MTAPARVAETFTLSASRWPKTRMRTKASIAGHPIHPMLVVVPLGALPTALVFDVLRVATGDDAWWLAAFGATAVGWAGIVLAIVPGLVDYLTSVPRRGPAWNVATVHMLNGFGLALLYLASLAIRWLNLGSPGPGAAWAALGISVVGALLLVGQGFLGGELRARHAIGVDTPAQAPPRVAPRAEDDEDEEGRRGPLGRGRAT